MPEPPEDVIVRNLIEVLERLHEDLDRMELWTAALGSFRHPISGLRARRSVSSQKRAQAAGTACPNLTEAASSPSPISLALTALPCGGFGAESGPVPAAGKTLKNHDLTIC
jgi:hypothetical protein